MITKDFEKQIEPIGKNGSNIYLINNLFAKDEIALIFHDFSSYENIVFDAQEISGEFKNIRINENNMELAQTVVSRIEQYVFFIFGSNIKKVTLPNAKISIKIQEIGQSHPMHSDASKTSHSAGLYGQNVSYSGILSLTDDYEGGELHFPGDGVFHKLGAGDAIIFPSSKHVHEIKEVTSGKRYTFLAFWENM